MPLFLERFFGQGGYQIFGHITTPPGVGVTEALQDFANRVLAAVSGRRNQCVDDRTRVVFWQVADFLSRNGPLALSFTGDLLLSSSPSPSPYNF